MSDPNPVEVRLNLTLTDISTLGSLAAKHATTETRMIQHAIVLEKFVDDVLAQGGSFIVQSADKSYHRVLNIQEGLANHERSLSAPVVGSVVTEARLAGRESPRQPPDVAR